MGGLTTASTYLYIGGYNASGAGIYPLITLPVEMRTSPTGAVAGTWATANSGQPTIETTTPNTSNLKITITASGQGLAYPNSSDDLLTFSAEL
jgi:hypothetical protein